jgi:hypothetical protein
VFPAPGVNFSVGAVVNCWSDKVLPYSDEYFLSSRAFNPDLDGWGRIGLPKLEQNKLKMAELKILLNLDLFLTKCVRIIFC